MCRRKIGVVPKEATDSVEEHSWILNPECFFIFGIGARVELGQGELRMFLETSLSRRRELLQFGRFLL